jgi:hypothetical protein
MQADVAGGKSGLFPRSRFVVEHHFNNRTEAAGFAEQRALDVFVDRKLCKNVRHALIQQGVHGGQETEKKRSLVSWTRPIFFSDEFAEHGAKQGQAEKTVCDFVSQPRHANQRDPLAQSAFAEESEGVGGME